MRAYLEATRSPWYSLIFILPLWLLYELMEGLYSVGHDAVILNGADAILLRTLSMLGLHGQLACGAALAVGAAVCVYRMDARHRKQPLKPMWFLGMLGESVLYAVLFGGLVAHLMEMLIPGFLVGLNATGAVMGFGLKFMTSLGAGVFEELLFRVLLMGGLAWAGTRLMHLKPVVSLTLAVIVSSLVFSAFHYVGSLGDTFTMASFIFRFLAGVVLAIIYRLRGFGIAACTHALYDVLLLLQGAH
jgi:membrane protease YdiL (CAAX protease family)